MLPIKLPKLTYEPAHYPGCCLSLSTGLFETLSHWVESLSHPALVLSIGSGTGLLETLLALHLASVQLDITVEGVEVASRHLINLYLPEEAINSVNGTWELTSRAEIADCLLFVYPRDPDLVLRYITMARQTSTSVQLVIWLGPKIDWEDFQDRCRHIYGGFDIQIVEKPGLVAYETMIVMRMPGKDIDASDGMAEDHIV